MEPACGECLYHVNQCLIKIPAFSVKIIESFRMTALANANKKVFMKIICLSVKFVTILVKYAQILMLRTVCNVKPPELAKENCVHAKWMDILKVSCQHVVNAISLAKYALVLMNWIACYAK
jgi:hypothetical protein